MQAIRSVGWIGCGVMGKSMCLKLIQAGYQVSLFSRTMHKAQQLIEKGAVWKDPIQIAKSCQAVMVMVGYPKDVQQLVLGEKGILSHMSQGSFLIDHTTSTPSLAVQIHQQAKLRKVRALDAPVSGGDVGAKNGTLTIMCGGDRQDFQMAKPILNRYGKVVQLTGGAGKGQHTKCTNQIILAGNMIGMCEGLIYAHKQGLDPAQIIQIIKTGAAGSFSLGVLGPRILSNNFQPGFYVQHYIKDLEICLEQSRRAGLVMPNLSIVHQLYVSLRAAGKGGCGTQALIKVLEGLSSHRLN